MEIVVIEKKVYETLINKMSFLEEKLYALQKKKQAKKLNDWLDSQEVCKLLKVSLRTLQTFRDTGKIGFTQVEKKIYYKPSEIDAFLKRGRIENSK